MCSRYICVCLFFFQIKKYIHGVKVQGVVLEGQKKTQQNLVKYYFLEKNHLQFLIYHVVMETHSCVLNVSVFFSMSLIYHVVVETLLCTKRNFYFSMSDLSCSRGNTLLCTKRNFYFSMSLIYHVVMETHYCVLSVIFTFQCLWSIM